MDANAAGLSPLSFGVNNLEQPEEKVTGKTDTGWEVIPLDSPVSGRPKLIFEGMEAETTSPNDITLLDRTTFPLKLSVRKMANAFSKGATTGGLVTGIIGAGAGKLIGSGVGAGLGGLVKLAKMIQGKHSDAIERGAMLGGTVGAVIGGLGAGIPGAAIAALAFGVCQLGERIVNLPFDIYHAVTANKLELPEHFFVKIYQELMEAAKDIMETIKVLSSPVRLMDALDELQVQAEDLDLEKLAKAYRNRSLEVHPDKGGTDASFQRLSAANQTLKVALGLSTPLVEQIQLQESLRQGKAEVDTEVEIDLDIDELHVNVELF